MSTRRRPTGNTTEPCWFTLVSIHNLFVFISCWYLYVFISAFVIIRTIQSQYVHRLPLANMAIFVFKLRNIFLIQLAWNTMLGWKARCQGDQADNGKEQKEEVNPPWEGELEFEEMARRWSGANWETVCRGQLWAECCVPFHKVICQKPNPMCGYQEVGCLRGNYVITRTPMIRLVPL